MKINEFAYIHFSDSPVGQDVSTLPMYLTSPSNFIHGNRVCHCEISLVLTNNFRFTLIATRLKPEDSNSLSKTILSWFDPLTSYHLVLSIDKKTERSIVRVVMNEGLSRHCRSVIVYSNSHISDRLSPTLTLNRYYIAH